MTSRRVGILGGTFDPIHIAHLIVAEEARARLNLDTVLFIPARRSPHKMDEAPASPEHRLRMVEAAVADNPHFSASPVEVEREGPSYTVETLSRLREAYGAGTELLFIMGSDSLEGLSRWREPERVLRLARIVAVSRPGVDIDLATLERELPGIRERLDLLPTLQIGISSTELRQRVRAGLPIRYMVPDAVARYIAEHDLYAGHGERTPGVGGAHTRAGCAAEADGHGVR